MLTTFLAGLFVLGGADNRVEGGLGLVVAVKEQRFAGGTPGNAIVDAPEGDDFDQLVLAEGFEEIGILRGEPLIGIVYEAALRGRGIVGHIRSGIALTTLGTVHVKLRNVY